MFSVVDEATGGGQASGPGIAVSHGSGIVYATSKNTDDDAVNGILSFLKSDKKNPMEHHLDVFCSLSKPKTDDNNNEDDRTLAKGAGNHYADRARNAWLSVESFC